MPEILLFIVIAVIWGIVKLSEGVSSVGSSVKSKQQFNEERNKKYPGRVIDQTQSLFERNRDIINTFEAKITNNNYSSYRSYRNHYIENETRDCINEICIAEGRSDIRPSSSYLSTWVTSAPREWVELSKQIEKVFNERKTKLSELETEISETRNRLQHERSSRRNPLDIRKVEKRNVEKSICIDDIQNILSPNSTTWAVKEKGLIDYSGSYKKFPSFPTDMENTSITTLNKDIDAYNNEQEREIKVQKENQKMFSEMFDGYKKKIKEKVVERFNYVLGNVELPQTLPKVWDIDFDPEQSIAIVEIKLPDVVHTKVFKKVKLKTSTVEKPLTQKEFRDEVPKIHPALMLRIAYEIYSNDVLDVIKLLVINGWVEFDDPKTGVRTKTYTASLAVDRSQIISINLSKVEPLLAFANLKGKSAGKLIDIIPVTPMMSLDKKDKRFIETKEVLNKLDGQTNLASMEWQDFENLIAELFQREFSEEGTEIKLTQSSRDKGVDAIVFNPDPIRGGKYVIQAKRYTNTVDVSAVRDLVAVVAHEGASRGILVTTSTFGADAYAFVQNKPITLLDGAKLLGLLEKHNYKFRIDLAEARKLYPSNGKHSI